MTDTACRPGCEYEPGHVPDHPCGQRGEQPGDPCRFCGEPVPDPPPCPHCWTPITIATFRDLFADNPRLETTVTTEPT